MNCVIDKELLVDINYLSWIKEYTPLKEVILKVPKNKEGILTLSIALEALDKYKWVSLNDEFKFEEVSTLDKISKVNIPYATHVYNNAGLILDTLLIQIHSDAKEVTLHITSKSDTSDDELMYFPSFIALHAIHNDIVFSTPGVEFDFKNNEPTERVYIHQVTKDKTHKHFLEYKKFVTWMNINPYICLWNSQLPDDEIFEELCTLNRCGVTTVFSCSGHLNKVDGAYSNAYLTMSFDIKLLETITYLLAVNDIFYRCITAPAVTRAFSMPDNEEMFITIRDNTHGGNPEVFHEFLDDLLHLLK